MKQVPLLFPFGLALFYALFSAAFIPQIKLLAFAPFLAILYNRFKFQSSLWVAALCGLIIDLLSSEFRLGIHALTYCLTTLLLYNQKKHFFEDKPLALCLFTLLISVLSTTVQLLLISIFDHALPFSFKLVLTDVILLPFADAIYAFVYFSCPMRLYLHIKKTGFKTFLSKLFKKFGYEKSETDLPNS